MALILAVNPGGTQSGTLARVARELQEHELIGADSCAVAIEALDEHKPALVLLPAASPAGEPELLNRLRTAIRGGIPTMKLPPPTSVNPRALADQIRQALGEVSAAPAEAPAPAAPTTSPHLIAAANAAISWVRARRATFSAGSAGSERPAAPPIPAAPVLVPAPAPFAFDDVVSRQEVPSYALRVDDLPSMDEEAEEEAEPAEPSPVSRESIVVWLPRVAVFGAGALLIGALVAYWPSLMGSGSSPKSGASAIVERPDSTPPAAGAPASGAAGSAGAAAPDTSPESKLSGWLAVFSPIDVRVSEANRAIPLDDRSRAMLSPGSHTLRFQNPALGYDETRTVEIKSTGTITVNLVPRTGLSVTSTEPAEVLVDGTKAGDTPLSGFQIDLGTHNVVVRSPSGERQISVTATSKPVQLDVDFSKP